MLLKRALYLNLDNPKACEILDAQKILRANLQAIDSSESHLPRKKRQRGKARMGWFMLDHAITHLFEHVRNDEACWRS